MKKEYTRKSKILMISAALAILAGGSWAMKQGSDSSAKSRSIKLISQAGACSGVQVRAPSGQSYIMTASHCKILADANRDIEAVTESGSHIKRHIIVEDPKSDLLLLEGIPGMKGLEIADRIWAGEHVRTFTHGGGLDTYKTEGVLIQQKNVQIPMADEKECSMPKYKSIELDFGILGAFKLCVMDVAEIATTTQTVPGSSGGMVVDDSNRLAGIVSAGDGHFGFLVRRLDIKDFIKAY